MATFLAALLVFIAAIVGLSLGVILNNRCIEGSCGGLNKMPDGAGHSVCGSCGSSSPEPVAKNKKATN